jgi:hypothetical protein
LNYTLAADADGRNVSKSIFFFEKPDRTLLDLEVL